MALILHSTLHSFFLDRFRFGPVFAAEVIADLDATISAAAENRNYNLYGS